ncbi:MAG: oligoribonuclease, partial [Bacillota bacterium]|nr:oligoribonuclease [Bacillota bacterium]
ALNKQNPHLDMIAMLNVGGKKMGFRTMHDDVNVAEFAKKFGGGGHPKASGCELTTEAFEKFVINVFPYEPVKPDPERNELNIKGAIYGTTYQNRKKEISNIIPLNDGTFNIIHMGEKLKEIFSNFTEAERFVKRNYASWLCHDDDCLEKLSADHQISKEEALANYSFMMDHLKGMKK